MHAKPISIEKSAIDGDLSQVLFGSEEFSRSRRSPPRPWWRQQQKEPAPVPATATTWPPPACSPLNYPSPPPPHSKNISAQDSKFSGRTLCVLVILQLRHNECSIWGNRGLASKPSTPRRSARLQVGSTKFCCNEKVSKKGSVQNLGLCERKVGIQQIEVF